MHFLSSKIAVGLLGLGAILAVLAACQPINPNRCGSTDWYARGFGDGEAGRADRLAAYAETCAEVGVSPDAEAYRVGRTDGLLNFCTVETGYDYGNRGRRNPSGVCEPEQASVVSTGWEFGDAIRRATRDLAQVDEQLIAAATITSDESLSTEERGRAAAEFRRLTREKERLAAFRDDLLTRYGAYRASLSGNSVPTQVAAG